MELSNEQKIIRDADIGNILVSAAAGSGKTTVLVQRIISKVCDGIDIDEILVVTFTKDAASSMRRKIDEKLRERIKEEKDEALIKRLQKQLDLLPNAYIQTIDSFCTRVIREKGYVIADSRENELIEGGNSILDENSLKIILGDAIMQALLDTYESEDSSSEGFLLLTSMFGDGRTDDSLADNIAYSYKKLRSLPRYLDKCQEIVDKRSKLDAEEVIINYDTIIDSVMTLFDSITDEVFTKLFELTDITNFVKTKNDKKQDAFRGLLDQIKLYSDAVKKAYADKDYFGTADAITNRKMLESIVKDDLLSGFKNNGDNDEELAVYKEAFGPIAALVNFIKPILNDIKIELTGKKLTSPGGFTDSAKPFQINSSYFDVLLIDRDKLLSMQKQRTLIIDAYVKLLKRVDDNYATLKGRVHGMDFPDQSHLAYKILENSDASGYYKAKFKEIYIDEYQDNSEIQDAIINCFRRPEGNVFRVGDVKQSIYKFRYANPYMFIDLMEKYGRKEDNGSLFLLNANYRSKNQILEFINAIFEQIMTREGAEIEYDDSHALKYPSTSKVESDYRSSVTLVDYSNISYLQGELLGVKTEVDRLVSMGIEYKDICILTRKHKIASSICKYLIEQGHSAVYNDDVAIFDDKDIHGICNVIISVGNIYRDEYLLGVLLSGYRYSNFTLGEVSRIILNAKRCGINPGSQYLFIQLQMFADADSSDWSKEDVDLQNRVKIFIDWINDLRSLQIITDISELTDRIYRDTGVFGSDTFTVEKFMIFKEWLCSNFMRHGSDVSAISSELENMKIKLGGNTAVRQKENEKKNAISCMTYHGSKGLEFKAVIVTELLSNSDTDKVGPIKFNPNIGFAVNDYSEEHVSISKSIERMVMDEQDSIEANSEGIRLLYVALTRAMDYLCVVAPIKTSGDRYKSLYNRLRRLKGKTIPRQYWLNENKGIEGAFFSGLMRLTGSSELENKFMEALGLSESSDYHFEYDDFDLNIITPTGDEFSSDEKEKYKDDFDVDGDKKYDSSESDDVSKSEGDNDSVGDASHLIMESTGLDKLYAATIDENGFPVFEKYPYQESSVIPFKVSVSQLKSGTLVSELPINLSINDLSYYMQKQTGEVGDTASEVGTFVHTLMRFIDLEKISQGSSSYEEEIDLLISDGVISSKDKNRAMAFESGIVSFASSSVGKELIASDLKGNASYEKPIVFSVPSGDNDSVLVQGIIDCIFKDDDGRYVVIDYKTDSFKDDVTPIERVIEIKRRHSEQVNLYAAAMESSGFEVKKKYIFLVRYGEFVEID